METGLSLTRIAEIAFMNHASVIHNIKRIDNELLFEDRYTVAELTEILRSLGFRFFKQGTKFDQNERQLYLLQVILRSC
jgi:hypothetical protein